MIKTKYIILCWILLLIVFTYFCIYRLSLYSNSNSNSNSTNKQYISNNFNNVQASQTQYMLNKIPIINYIDNIIKNNKINDMVTCSNIYDDDYAVRVLGYNNCKTANADYLMRNMDTTQKFGNAKSLSQLCPVSTNSDKYITCMKQLLTKFSNNVEIVNTINTDMTSSINDRINARALYLDNIENNLSDNLPHSINNTINNLGLQTNNNHIPYYNTIADNAINYYQLKNNFSKSIFDNISKSPTITSLSPTITSLSPVSPVSTASTESSLIPIDITNFNIDIAKKFFGYYIPVKGQFLAFNDLSIMLKFKKLNLTIPKFPKNNIKNNFNINDSNPTYNLLLTIRDNTTNNKILYNVINLKYYLQYKTIIEIDILNSVSISVENNSLSILQKLLSTLGIKMPCKLLLAESIMSSTENIKHTTYKLLNSNMQSIIILNKI